MTSKTTQILIYGINFSPELTGIGKYTGEMTEWLIDKNIKCTVVTSFPYYPHWKIQQPYKGIFYKKEVLYNGLLTIYRCPMYVPKKVTGIKRMIHEASFLISSFFVFVYLCFNKSIPNLICIVPPFHLGLVALVYKWVKGATINYHIQDLQIEAAKSLKIIKSKWLFNLFDRIENYILKKVNTISTISPEMSSKIHVKSQKKILFFPNWVDCEKYYPIDNPKQNRHKWGFNEGQKLVLYSGSVGEKQGLDKILDIAENFKTQKEIAFIIAGSGPFLEELKAKANYIQLTNIHFLPLQPTLVFNEFLNMVDLHLIFQKENATDLVMPSKLTTILAIGGLVLINAQEKSGLNKLIKKNEIGFSIDTENINDLAKTIENILTNVNDDIKKNAREYAIKNIDKEVVLSNYFKINIT